MPFDRYRLSGLRDAVGGCRKFVNYNIGCDVKFIEADR